MGRGSSEISDSSQAHLGSLVAGLMHGQAAMRTEAAALLAKIAAEGPPADATILNMARQMLELGQRKGIITAHQV